MRRRSDKNQRGVVSDLRALGFSVQVLSEVGKGVPDLLLGRHEYNFLVELKSGKKWMTDDEKLWHSSWKGHVIVASSTKEILDQIDLYMLAKEFKEVTK